MNGLYDKARREKIRELKRLMQELISDGDEEQLEAGELDDAMAEAGDEAEGVMDEAAVAEAPEGDAMAEEEDLDGELGKMRREFFKSKGPKPSRPGSKMMFAKMNEKPSLKRGRGMA